MRLIDADALIKEIWIIRGSLQMLDNTQGADLIMHGLWMVEQKINDAPTIEPKRGEWIVDEEQGTSTCSACGIVWQFTDGTNGSDFCPNCGARMLKGAEAEG